MAAPTSSDWNVAESTNQIAAIAVADAPTGVDSCQFRYAPTGTTQWVNSAIKAAPGTMAAAPGVGTWDFQLAWASSQTGTVVSDWSATQTVVIS
jgi:hypothetical protein